MSKAKRIDRLKDLAIALLLVSAVYLFYRTVFYEAPSSTALFGGGQTAQSIASPGGSAALNAKPVYVAATGSGGAHTAAKYGSEARDKLLSQFSASLGEALGSAGSPKEVTADEWRSALRGSGVFYDYLYPQPLSDVASSLGTAAKGGAASDMARRLCLSVSGDSVRLYYISAENDGVYRCTTAVSAATLAAKLGDYQSCKAKFAFESGSDYAALDPYFLFSGEETKLTSVTAANPLTEGGELSKLFGVFGMSSRSSEGYIEKGGTVVYVEGSKSLRVDNTGSVLFSVTDSSGVAIQGGSELTAAEIASACAQIVNGTIGETSGAASLVLRSCKADSATGDVSVEFAYMIGGVPVTLADGTAAVFTVKDGMITRAELCFRKYTLTGDTLTALPEAQAAVITQNGGGEPVLTYDDRSDGVSASWIVQ